MDRFWAGFLTPLLKKQQPQNNICPHTTCNGCNVYNEKCIGFNGNCNGPNGSLLVICCLILVACYV